MDNILQWNCNSFYSRLAELQLLLSKHHSHYVCLQEMNFSPNKRVTVKGYKIFRNDKTTGQKASGGLAILVKNNNYAEEIILQTELEAVAIKTRIPEHLTICNLCLPPGNHISENELVTLIEQLPKPYIICGDFNSYHNVSWGSLKTCNRGKLIEKIFQDVNMLNNG